MMYTFFNKFEFEEKCPFSYAIISYAQKQTYNKDLCFDKCQMSKDEKTYTTVFTFRDSFSNLCKEITVALAINDDKTLSFNHSIKTLSS